MYNLQATQYFSTSSPLISVLRLAPCWPSDHCTWSSGRKANYNALPLPLVVIATNESVEFLYTFSIPVVHLIFTAYLWPQYWLLFHRSTLQMVIFYSNSNYLVLFPLVLWHQEPPHSFNPITISMWPSYLQIWLVSHDSILTGLLLSQVNC